MEILNKIVYVLMLLSALGVIVLVLLQHGKGADMGTGFGAGASGSLFGATGSANFLSRTTAVLATVFFLSTLGLAYFATNRPVTAGANDGLLPSQIVPAPKSDVPATLPGATPAPAKGNDIPK